jgi:tetratricopeptide (TPR) repeat protein
MGGGLNQPSMLSARPCVESTPPDASHWLRCGQSLEAKGDADSLVESVSCYDQAIALLQSRRLSTTGPFRDLAIAWMNRGNALQKLSDPAKIRRAVEAYDQAINLVTLLDHRGDEALTNSLGSAWLNRSHALQRIKEIKAATDSIEQAISLLSALPYHEGLGYRLNLAGAQVNLAHLLLESAVDDHCLRAHTAATTALQLTAQHELVRAGFAELGLKARRILCEVTGRWLVESGDIERRKDLVARTGDVVDDGLSLARRWEAIGESQFRPLALRLFRFGTAYYRRYQPHFLADFILENIDAQHTSDAFVENSEFMTIANEALQLTRQELRTGYPVLMDAPDTKRRLQTLHGIDDALLRLGHLSSQSQPVPPS